MKDKEIKNVYVHETFNIWSQDGEVHIHTSNDHHIVFNAQNLYNDLDLIISLVVKEKKRMDEMCKKSIKESIKKL